jgi:hypothetical protein
MVMSPLETRRQLATKNSNTVFILGGERVPSRACGFCLTDFLLVFSESLGGL